MGDVDAHCVFRQGDNGNVVAIAHEVDELLALAMVDEFAGRGHKQMDWV